MSSTQCSVYGAKFRGSSLAGSSYRYASVAQTSVGVPHNILLQCKTSVDFILNSKVASIVIIFMKVANIMERVAGGTEK